MIEPPPAISMATARTALELVESAAFEDFFKQFMPSVADDEFLPTGGMHDGGADGLSGHVHRSKGDARHFYQASIAQDYRAKIRHTVEALRSSGRDPRQLTYVTSETVPLLDKVENELSRDLSCSIRIRDREYIASRINETLATLSAYRLYLEPVLLSSGDHLHGPVSPNPELAQVYAFLQLELSNTEEGESFIDSLTDSLILWGLEGTDPDEEVFRTADEIRSKVYDALPWAEGVIDSRIDGRLAALKDKGHEGGRAVRWYAQDGHYCLPWETRRRLDSDYAADVALEARVVAGFEQRLAERLPDVSYHVPPRLAQVTLRALHGVMQEQGYEVAAFVAGKTGQDPTRTVLEKVSAELHSEGLTQAVSRYREAVASVLRDAIYRSTSDERDLLRGLSRVYALMFGLGQDAMLVKFFDGVNQNLTLLVGSDILIRCLSERYLHEPDQQTRNLLRAASAAGVDLVLTEVVLEEVVSHLRLTNEEFERRWMAVEEHVDEDLARQAPLILIRTYFYARAGLAGSYVPASWKHHIEQFVSLDGLGTDQAKDELRTYLEAAFGMRYMLRSELYRVADKDRLELFADRLVKSGVKESPRLAKNDAVMACGVYGLRQAEKAATEHGYRTWWLTQESRLLREAQALIDRYAGVRFMLRPEFLLHFLGLAPSARQARQRLGDLFPSLLGVRLTRRVHPHKVGKILAQIEQAQGMEDARRKVAVRRAVDELKSDYDKQYVHNLD